MLIKKSIVLKKGGISYVPRTTIRRNHKNFLEDRGSLSAKEMVDHFHVSKDTIRRDFSILAKEKRARRNSWRFIANSKARILDFKVEQNIF